MQRQRPQPKLLQSCKNTSEKVRPDLSILTPGFEILNDDIAFDRELLHEPFVRGVLVKSQIIHPEDLRTLFPHPASSQSPRSSCSFPSCETTGLRRPRRVLSILVKGLHQKAIQS